jgi:hypothetical protein
MGGLFIQARRCLCDGIALPTATYPWNIRVGLMVLPSHLWSTPASSRLMLPVVLVFLFHATGAGPHGKECRGDVPRPLVKPARWPKPRCDRQNKVRFSENPFIPSTQDISTTNFWPLCNAFLLQQQDLVAIEGVLATNCTFGCDRWDFCHANCFMAPSTKIVAISKCYRNHLENGCNKLSLLPRFKLRCK